MIRKVFLMLGLTLISGSSAWAIPQTLNFQGFLKESGSPVTGSRDITIRICGSSDCSDVRFTDAYHTAINGHAVWVSTGIFNVFIGEFTPGGIPLNVFDGSDRFIEVTAGTTLLLPRQTITSVAHAFFAATAATLTPTASIQISSAILTATGPNQYSLQTSSGINVQNGGVIAPFFSGTFVGNGAGLTGISGTDSSKVAKSGDTMTGQLTLSGSTLTVTGNAFSVGGATLAAVGGRVGIGTSSPATKLHLNSGAMTIDGSSAGISVAGPSTATYFYGNGSGLTGVPTDGTKVAKAGDTMTGQLTLSGSSLTVSGAGGVGVIYGVTAATVTATSSITASAFFGDGSHLIGVTDGGKVAKVGDVMTGQLTLSGSSLTVSGAGGVGVTYGLTAATVTATSSITASAFFGDGSHLTGGIDSTKVAKAGDTMTGQLTLAGSSLTVKGAGGVGITYGLTAATVTATSSITASAFFGDGSHLTGITAGSTESAYTVNVTATEGNNHAFVGCNVAGSSITATIGSNGSTVMAYLQSPSWTVDSTSLFAWILIDDKFGLGESAGNAPFYQLYTGGWYQTVSFAVRFANVSAGTHTFCYGFGSGTGIWHTGGSGSLFWTETKN